MIQNQLKTVADPSDIYDSLSPLWKRSRAVCRGERYVKLHDKDLDTVDYSNLLIPFSPSMTRGQYNFYKAEAELPGIASTFGKTLVGGLLRKMPTLKFPAGVPDEVHDWIINEFGNDGSPLISFLDEAI